MNEMEARDYLQRTDFYFTVDKYQQLTEEKRNDLTQKREFARGVIRNEISGGISE